MMNRILRIFSNKDKKHPEIANVQSEDFKKAEWHLFAKQPDGKVRILK